VARVTRLGDGGREQRDQSVQPQAVERARGNRLFVGRGVPERDDREPQQRGVEHLGVIAPQLAVVTVEGARGKRPPEYPEPVPDALEQTAQLGGKEG
jgi:hypothetical protein